MPVIIKRVVEKEIAIKRTYCVGSLATALILLLTLPSAKVLEAQAPIKDGRSRVVLHVREPSGTARTSSWVQNGIPFGKGELPDPAKTRVVGPDGRELALDTVPLSLHDDGSVKWLLVSFPLNVEADADVQCTLEYGPTVVRTQLLPTLAVEETDQYIRINAGTIRAQWSKTQGTAGIGDVWVDLNNDGRIEDDAEHVIIPAAATGLRVSRVRCNDEGAWEKKGFLALMSAEGTQVTLERVGQLCAVVRIDGWHVDKAGEKFCQYTQRWTVRSGTRALEGTHTLVYTGVPENDFLGTAAVELTASIGNAPRVTAGFKGGGQEQAALQPEGHALVWQESPTDATWIGPDGLKRKDQPGEGWLLAEGGRASVCAAIRNFDLRYPKELKAAASENGIALSLYSYPEDLSAPLDFRRYADVINPGRWGYESGPNDRKRSGQGAAFSHDLYVGFGGPSQRDRLIAEARSFLRPLVARPEAAYVAATEALYPFGPHRKGSYPRGETFLRTIADIRVTSQRDFGWYGVLDYGDAPKGSAEGAWIMWGGHGWWTKTSPVPCYLSQFFRTGQREYYDFALAMARNVSDVSVVHYADGKGSVWRNAPEDVGSVHRHGYQHWSGYAGSAQYTGGAAEGLVEAYLISGEGRYLDVVLENVGFNLSRRGRWGFDYMLRVYCQLCEVFRARPGGKSESERFAAIAVEAADKMPAAFKDRWPGMVGPAVAYASRFFGLQGAEKRIFEYRKENINGLIPAVCRYRLKKDKADLATVKKLYTTTVNSIPEDPSESKNYRDVVARLGRSYPWNASDYLGYVQGLPAAMRLFEELGLSEKDVLQDTKPAESHQTSNDVPPPYPEGLLLADDMENNHDALLIGSQNRGATYTAGIAGHGLRIDGNDRYYHFANPSFRPRGWRTGTSARFNVLTGTVSFWYKPAGAGVEGVLFAETGAPGGESMRIELRTGKRIVFIVTDDQGRRSELASDAIEAIRPDTWIHVAAVWDFVSQPVGLQLFANGQAVSKTTLTGDRAPQRRRAGVNLDLGSWQGRRQARGVYDMWRVWDRPLNVFEDAQIKPDSKSNDIHAVALLNDPMESAKESALHGGKASGEFVDGWLGQAFQAGADASLSYPAGLGAGKSLQPDTRFNPMQGSIEMRIKLLESKSKRRSLLNADDMFWFGLTEGRLALEVYTPLKKQQIVAKKPFPTDTDWHHVACTWDARTGKLAVAVDGQRTSADIGRFTPCVPGKRIHIGSDRKFGPADALIDQLKIWDAPKQCFLSAEDILFYASFDQKLTGSADYAEGKSVCMGLSDHGADGRIGGGVKQWGLSQMRFLPFAHIEAGGKEPLVNIAPDAGTICFWMRPSAWTVDGNRHVIFHAPLHGKDKIKIAVQNKRALNIQAPGLNNSLNIKFAPQADKWYHIAVAWDRSQGKLAAYADGNALLTKEGMAKSDKHSFVTSYNDFFQLGGWYEREAVSSHAAFDELVIYRTFLLPEQVAEMYKRQKGGVTP